MNKQPPINILLADDDADDRFLFESAMKEVSNNCHLFIAQDGAVLNEMLNTIPHPNIIMLDVNMPKKNGLICLKEIRGLRDFDNIPVIMLSTGTNDKDVQFAYHNRADLFIRKPDSYSALKQIINYCLNANLLMHRQKQAHKFLINDFSELPTLP